ncbi:hypothetical protein BRD02_00155 [Halobacteriales archaeon QS_8_69_73]|nr:MAG: hypothetical protein BRD02_00155 [Halobacteriales archaeon QS_8_69_73]
MAASTERGPRRRLGRSDTGLAVLGVSAVLGGVVALEAAGTRGAALGAGLAVAMLLAWLAVGVPYAFVVGQVGLVVGPGAGTTALALQAILVGLLLVDVGERHDRQVLAVTAGAAAGLLGLIVVVDGLLAAAGALLAAVGAAGYLLHRYELVALGLAGDAS